MLQGTATTGRGVVDVAATDLAKPLLHGAKAKSPLLMVCEALHTHGASIFAVPLSPPHLVLLAVPLPKASPKEEKVFSADFPSV